MDVSGAVGHLGRGSEVELATVRPGVVASQQTREGWDRLVRLHDRRLVVSLLARGVPMERARELAQETWRCLFERDRAGELSRLELPGLAIRQASFFAKDDRRRARLEPEPRASLPEVSEPRPDAEAFTISRERLEQVERIVLGAGKSQQRVFRLVYGEGLDHATTATKMGLSVQRVRQIVCEVRRTLRLALDEEKR